MTEWFSQCHAEKRAPSLYEPPPVVDDCMNCHTPHGSNNQPLLKAKMPWLCQDCHAESAPHPGNVYSAVMLPGRRVAPPAQLPFRGGVNCHSQIHGSNNPGGNSFRR